VECSHVEELLSQYVDDALDASTRREMERHFRACPRCDAELQEYRRYLQVMKTLDEVRAPADFLEKVHRRIEGESLWRRWFEKLFVPLRIKLPLEFAGVLVTAVLLVVFYQHLILHQRPALDSGGSETSQSPIVSLKEESQRPQVLHQRLEVPPSPPPAEPAREKAAIHLSLSLKALPKAAVAKASEEESIAALAPTEGAERPLGAIVRRQDVGQNPMDSRSLPADGVKRDKEDELSGAAALQEQQMQTEVRAMPLDLLAAVKDAVRQLDGELVLVEDPLANELPRITIQIPAGKYQLLLDSLQQLGRFDPSPPTLPAGGTAESQQVEISLTITK